MSERKAPTYAVNNQQIAVALRLKPNRRTLIQVGGWRTRADFPVKDKRGYVITELRAWHGRFVAETPLFDADALKLAREQAIIKSFTNGKSLDKFNDEERGVLAKHGLVPGDAAQPNGHGPAVGALEKVTTQKAVLVELQRHYRGRLTFEITQQNVSDWHNGKNLPDPESPPAPHKDGNYFVLGQWIEWFDRWILPHWAVVREGQAGLFPAGELAQLRAANEREDLLHQQFLRQTEQNLWVRKSDLAPAVDGVVKGWCDELDRVEHAIPRSMDAALRGLGVADELRLAIMEKLRSHCCEFNDGLRRSIQERLGGLKPADEAKAV